MRPKELHHKTKFIEVEMTNFYTYKKFYKDFKRSFDIDYENINKNINLFIDS